MSPKTDPDYDAIRSRAFGYAVSPAFVDEAVEAGRAELAHDRRRGTADASLTRELVDLLTVARTFLSPPEPGNLAAGIDEALERAERIIGPKEPAA